MIDAAHCQRVEPGLNRETALHAGIYLPDGEVGNCRQFAHVLRDEAHRRGVQFRFHSKVTALHAGQQPSLVYEHAPPEESTIVAGNSRVESDGEPKILIEKDWSCLKPREGEDDSDAYPHPEQTKKT